MRTWSWPLCPGTFQRHLRPFPVWSVSAPAQDHIWLMRLTWKGRAALECENPSLPQLVTMYLLAQIRAASRASEERCPGSSDSTWPQRGTSSTFASLRPRSKMRILASKTPRQKRDRSGLLLQYRYHWVGGGPGRHQDLQWCSQGQKGRQAFQTCVLFFVFPKQC